MVVALLGLLGSCCNVACSLWLYLFVMFFMIAGLLSFMVFAIVVTNRGVSETVSGRGYMEYRLDDYSNWLQKRVGTMKPGVESRVAYRKLGSVGGSMIWYSKRPMISTYKACLPYSLVAVTLHHIVDTKS